MKRFLIVLAVVLLAGAGYLTYEKWVKSANLSVWSFIPDNAVLVYESSQALNALRETEQTNIWKNLSHISQAGKIPEHVYLLDTLAGEGNFTRFFKGSNALISLNVTSSSDFDFLFVVEITSLTQQTYISKALAYFREHGYSQRTRKYLDFTITEIVGTENKSTFTYIYYKNFFIGSFTAFLVEDAIRTIDDKNRASFAEKNRELFQIAHLEKDQGDLYLNLSRLGSFIDVFKDSNTEPGLAKSSFLDLKVGTDAINMSGFTFADKPNHFLTSFSSTSGGAFDMAEIIPNETSWMYHIASSSPTDLGSSLQTFLQSATPEVLKYREKLKKDIDFDVNYTWSLIDQEIGVITLESGVTGENSQLLILEITDMGEALQYFNSVGERVAKKEQDTVYVEVYGDYQIRKLPAEDFPYALLGNIARGFGHTYYLQFRNYLVFSNHLHQLKNFIISIENENTWSKSLRTNRFIEQTNKEANFGLFVNLPRAWNQIKTSLKHPWEVHFSRNQVTYRSLEFLAFQFSTVDEKFYTNVTVYQPEVPKTKKPERIDALQSLTLPGQITTKPWLVVNHNTHRREVFVQDASNTVYLVSENFEVLWSKTLDEKINSDIQQLDYYKNGKLQLVFTTPSAVHIIDRTGEYLPEFPRGLPEGKKIDHFSLIDYDNTKNYRFGIASNDQVYLTNKNVKPLEGWDPKPFERPLVHAPLHIRVERKDMIMCLQRDGKLFLLNRRGENFEGSPKTIEKTITEKPFVKNTNTLNSSALSMVTTDGEVIEISLQGKVLRRDQLYKPSTSSRFSILEDVTGDTYLILRQTENQHEILDPHGNLLFEKDYLTKQSMFYQYYQLGSSTELIIFIEPESNSLYIYNRDGKLITGRPLTASQPVSIMKHEDGLQVYRISGHNLELISLD